MKLALCSDLHLTFGDLVLKNEENADVLILSGDICEVSDLTNSYSKNYVIFHGFFKRISEEFPHVVYVCGNHEHYYYDFKNTVVDLKTCLSEYQNIHVLEKETFVLDDVTFIGSTLWTDMNKNDSLTLLHIKYCMNDYRAIKNSNKMITFKKPVITSSEAIRYEFTERPARFTPEDTVEEHNKTLNYIKCVVDDRPNDKFIVVGHHQPSKKSTHPYYEYDVIVNGAYNSDLDDFIINRPQIKVWTAGHTHHNFDYKIGETRILCNPRGYYSHEKQADDFKLQYFEVK
jgi:UDP-2,3-diacylglucosamine pyrophosphatase LpxH